MKELTLYQIISIIGVPSIITMCTWVYRRLKHNEESQKEESLALKLGVQALLRSQMINDYNRWSKEKYAPIYAKENFENCWKQYHALGANGVMDNIHETFMKLPTQKPKTRKNANSTNN